MCGEYDWNNGAYAEHMMGMADYATSEAMHRTVLAMCVIIAITVIMASQRVTETKIYYCDIFVALVHCLLFKRRINVCNKS